jgi:hypothetical protein
MNLAMIDKLTAFAALDIDPPSELAVNIGYSNEASQTGTNFYDNSLKVNNLYVN